MIGSPATRGGGTGQAATTSFFAPIPDRFNCLIPAHAVSGDMFFDEIISADNVNLWKIYNPAQHGGANVDTVSLGALTTAPDGNNTAQKVVEATNNGYHRLMAGWDTSRPPNPHYDMRLSVFLKAAGRTKVSLVIGTGDFRDTGNPFFPESFGMITTFDLANGTIDTPGTYSGPADSRAWTSLEDSIVAFGNGWYRCTMDVRVKGTVLSPRILCQVRLNSGSTDSYTGDGSSGVYVWRSTLLPVGAWDLSGRIEYFDDFPDLSNFDLSNTRADTFDWYLYNKWPRFPALVSLSNTHLDATTPSVLHIFSSDQPNLSLGSAAWIGGSWNSSPPPNGTFSGVDDYVGNMWMGAPGVWEFRQKWNNNVAGPKSGTTSVWAVNKQGLLGHYPGEAIYGVEIDWNEIPAGPGVGEIIPYQSIIQSDYLFTSLGVPKLASTAGVPAWLTAPTFFNDNVMYGGELYRAKSVSTTPGANPAATPAQWDVVTLVYGPLAANIPALDLSEFHTYSTIWLPYTKDRNNRSGHFLNFFDGVFTTDGYTAVGSHGHYTYNALSVASIDGSAATTHLAENHLYPIFIAGGVNYDSYFDYVKITR